jgi:hypothetical protein
MLIEVRPLVYRTSVLVVVTSSACASSMAQPVWRSQIVGGIGPSYGLWWSGSGWNADDHVVAPVDFDCFERGLVDRGEVIEIFGVRDGLLPELGVFADLPRFNVYSAADDI